MSNPKYKFSIYLNDNIGVKTIVYPNYKDDIAKEIEQENNQKFYRAKLSGKFNFITKDFDFIISMPFDTKFNLVIENSLDNGQTWQNYFLGKFYLTDCEIDEDNKKLSVQPDPIDEYTDVLAGLDKEFNLIPLAPVTEALQIKKRPLIQVYIPGQTIVSCYLSGNFWEQEAREITDRAQLVNTYYFALCNMLKEIQITQTTTSLPVGGLFTGRMTVNGSNFTGTLYSITNQNYKINVSATYQKPWFTGALCQIIRISDNVVVYEYTKTLSGNAVWDNEDFQMQPKNGAPAGTVGAEMATYNIYARYLLDVEKIGSLNTYSLPADDIVDYNRNYRRAIGYAIDIAYISMNFSTEPTEWGRAEGQLYYAPPYSIYYDKFYPIARSTWRYSSIWFAFAYLDNITETQGRKSYTLKDTYTVSSVISVLLKQIAPTITHEPFAEYSEFLYSNTNPVSYNKFKLLLTQKTNVLAGNYSQPAQKAPTTLKEILDMLRDCYRCFWYIEDNKFKIEHVSWFMNGGTYSGGMEIGLDLTEIQNTRNGKNWAFSSSKYTFDKMDMPERYQFEWGDDVTTPFEGLPIEIISGYVMPGKIEEVTVSRFNSDIDLMLLNPSAMNNEGFALFAATTTDALLDDPNSYFGINTGGTNQLTDPKVLINPASTGRNANLFLNASISTGGSYTVVFYDSANVLISEQLNVSITGAQVLAVFIPLAANSFGLRANGTVSARINKLEIPDQLELPFINRSVDGVSYSLQNGLLAFVYLQSAYYKYDMPARYIKINGYEDYANGIERKKKQTVSFPMLTAPDPLKLIKTNLGSGQIDKMSINLQSLMSKTTIKYDTE